MQKISITKVSKTKLLIGIIAVLVVADGIITRFLITRELGTELNPFLKTLVMDERFLWFKIIGGLLVALILWDISRRATAKGRLKRLTTTLYILFSLYLLIVLWNSLIIVLSIIY
jgi:hypothetical protein